MHAAATRDGISHRHEAPINNRGTAGIVNREGRMVSAVNVATKQSALAPMRESSPHAAGVDDRSSARALPPVLILGGEANALSVARDLGHLGVKVFMLGEA